MRLRQLGRGLLAGAAASVVMNRYQRAISRRVAGYERAHGAQSVKAVPGAPEEDPTTAVAGAVGEAAGVPLRRREREAVGTLGHYLFGAAAGGLYAALPDGVRAAAGLPFGAAVWAGADLIALPSARLTHGPGRIPFWQHAYSLSSHLVYGVFLELGLRSLEELHEQNDHRAA
ncbi:MAG: hypothetical protein SFV54_20335 [Bryobacteraceae bacterium]|nr:hypothetical protein [Bryobacteraceae bacterium]